MPAPDPASGPIQDQSSLLALLDWVRGVSDSLLTSFQHPGQLAENTLAGPQTPKPPGMMQCM